MLLQQFYKRCCSSPPSALEGSATPAVAAAALAASGGPAGGLTAEMIKAVLNVVRARGASQCITLAVSIIAFLNRTDLESLLSSIVFGAAPVAAASEGSGKVVASTPCLRFALQTLLRCPAALREVAAVALAGTFEEAEAAKGSLMNKTDVVLFLYNQDPTGAESRRAQAGALDSCVELAVVPAQQTAPHDGLPVESLARVLQRIVGDERQPIKTLFGRLLCQVSKRIPVLNEFLATSVLSAMVNRKVWKSAGLWRGFLMTLSTLWADQKENLYRSILLMPEKPSTELLQLLQQRYDVTSELACLVSADPQSRASCPEHLKILLGLN
eukprot:GHVT01103151.1.p1 GENE.GHVT01103151.1~~GHVT01103151.1.p1  ORF type:complete len:327 (-),score=70.31 GHVT01103151.1:812-1792(-)